MTNKEIKQAEKELCSAEKMEKSPERQTKLKNWAEKHHLHLVQVRRGGMESWQDDMFEVAHRFLQTATMVNTCNTAKWSCIWAAVAATLSLFSVVAAWLIVYLTVNR